MGAIRRVTKRCILLEHGRMKLDAPTQEVIDAYLTQAAEGLTAGVFVRGKPRPADCPFYVQRVTTRREAGGDPAYHFDCDESVFIHIDYSMMRKVPGLYGYVALHRLDGTMVYEGDSTDASVNPLKTADTGPGVLTIEIPPRTLGAGNYQIYLSIASDIDAAGPRIDLPGIVGEFRLDDPSTRLGNRRAGHLSTRLAWRSRPGS
jgi:lipopolysaccharide transport system ATP-binding protein